LAFDPLPVVADVVGPFEGVESFYEELLGDECPPLSLPGTFGNLWFSGHRKTPIPTPPFWKISDHRCLLDGLVLKSHRPSEITPV